MEGDFVVASVKGKKSSLNSIVRIDVVDDAGFEGIFLKKISKKPMGQTVFVANEKDKTVFTQDDVIKKLLPPKIVGGSARRECQLMFSNIDKWSINKHVQKTPL